MKEFFAAADPDGVIVAMFFLRDECEAYIADRNALGLYLVDVRVDVLM